MSTRRTYRVASESRGIEGPFPASLLLQLAREGMLFGGDRIERAPGQWASASSSPELRAALADWSQQLVPVTASNASAAMLGLRALGASLAMHGAGRAALLAVASQHADLEVASMAAQLLHRPDMDGLGALARQVVGIRRGAESQGSDLYLARKGVARVLPDSAWAAYVEVVRRIDPWGGVEPLWRQGAEGSPPTALLRERRIRTLESIEGSSRTPIPIGDTIDAILACGEQLESGDGSSILDLSGHAIEDLERLPSRALDVIRRVDWIDLSGTPLREVPSWLFEGKSRVSLGSTSLRQLPELRISEAMNPSMDLCLDGTRLQGFPESWGALRLDCVSMDRCPLHPRGLEWMPRCDRLSAVRCGLTELEVLGSAPAELDLSSNGLTRIPEAIRGRMNRLRRLQLSENRITDLPGWLVEAPKLRELDLQRNLLTFVDVSLSSMPSLREVHLQGNRISEVVDEAFADRRLLTINLGSNALTSMPPIVYPTGLIDLSDNPLGELPCPLNSPSASEVEWDGDWPDDNDDQGDGDDGSGDDAPSVDFGDDDGDVPETSDASVEIELEVDEDSDEGELDVSDAADDEELELDEDGSVDIELADGDETSMDEELEWAGDDDDDDEVEFEGPFASERACWDLNALTVTATNTAITSIPGELLDLKLVKLELDSNARLRTIPADILAMPTLKYLSVRDCPQLRASDLADRRCWSGWPKERVAAVKAGREDQEDEDSETCWVDLSGTSFTEVPNFLSRATLRLELELTQMKAMVWPTGAVRPDGLAKLDLADSDIKSIESVGKAPSMTELVLSGASEIPSWIGQCRRLETLTLPGLPERSYPKGLESLAECRTLEIRGRALTAVPAFVGCLDSLKYLTLAEASIAELPALLGRCKALKRLVVRDCAIRRVDPAVLALPGLETLEISASGTLELPDFPKDCALEVLEVQGASVLRIPASISRCTSMKRLTLAVGHVELPESIGEMASLQNVVLPENGELQALRARLSRRLPATDFA